MFRFGDKANAVFLLLSGEVGLYSPSDPSTAYMNIRQDETFGEMGLVEGELRNARAQCLSNCLVLEIEKRDFDIRYENADLLIQAMMKSLSARLHDANRKLSMTVQNLLPGSDARIWLISQLSNLFCLAPR